MNRLDTIISRFTFRQIAIAGGVVVAFLLLMSIATFAFVGWSYSADLAAKREREQFKKAVDDAFRKAIPFGDKTDTELHAITKQIEADNDAKKKALDDIDAAEKTGDRQKIADAVRRMDAVMKAINDRNLKK